VNTEEVCKMIDDITEGKPFSRQNLNGEQVNIASQGDGFALAGTLTNPRTAREIAGALVAWANRKEGVINNFESITVAQIAESPAPEDCNFPEVWRTSAPHRRFHYTHKKCLARDEGNVQNDLLSEKKEKDVAIWRENWYHRNIRNMTRETMERNMSDLQKIRRSAPFPSDEFDDIQKAIDILHVALNGGNNDGV
jgi:hypothetical protein